MRHSTSDWKQDTALAGGLEGGADLGVFAATRTGIATNMPELRIDPLSGHRTIVAGERSRRPGGAPGCDPPRSRSTRRATPSPRATRTQTPPELLRVLPSGPGRARLARLERAGRAEPLPGAKPAAPTGPAATPEPARGARTTAAARERRGAVQRDARHRRARGDRQRTAAGLVARGAARRAGQRGDGGLAGADGAPRATAPTCS